MCRMLVCFLLLSLPVATHANIASTGYVDDKVASNVQTSGDQEISGTKTYNTSPIIPTPPLPEE